MSNTALAEQNSTSLQELKEWQEAQQIAMNHVWDNQADEVWNDV